MVLFFLSSLELLNHFKKLSSLKYSGSTSSEQKSLIIFSGPGGCNQGSILVAATTFPGFIYLIMYLSKSGQAYISAWNIITISLVA